MPMSYIETYCKKLKDSFEKKLANGHLTKVGHSVTLGSYKMTFYQTFCVVRLSLHLSTPELYWFNSLVFLCLLECIAFCYNVNACECFARMSKFFI